MLTPEQQQEIDDAPLGRQLLERVQSLLPADDAEFDRWLDDALRRQAYNEYVSAFAAAISIGRRVDPHHLVKGGMIFAGYGILPEIVMRMPEGEVPESLIQSAETNIPRRHQALMVATLAVWCKLYRASVFPPKLIELVRAIARHRAEDSSIMSWYGAVAVLTKDAGLATILRRANPALASDAEWTKLSLSVTGFEKMLSAIPQRSILDAFGNSDKPQARLLAQGTTMRRAVARVGRNEPCPCGSGKKYKKCCFEKDQERLRHSTSIEGVTAEELDAAPDAHLNAETFAKLPWQHLDRIDPTKLPQSLVEPYFNRLMEMNTIDRLVDDFEKVGYLEPLHAAWRTAAISTAARQRPDLVERLVTLRRNAGFTDDDLDDIIRFSLLEENPADWLAFLEQRMDEAICYDDDPNELLHLAQATAYSSYPAIGIFVCRSIMPLLEPKQAAEVRDHLLKARDRRGDLPEDPMIDVLDKLLARQSEESDQSEAEHETLMALEAKRREARELKERIERVQHDLKRAEEQIAQNASKSVAETGDDEELRRIRRKLEGLKGELREVHNERNVYRRKYEEEQEHVLELSKQRHSAPEDSNAQDDAEADLLLPPDTSGIQPVRLIDFPRNFDQRLHEAPRQVARGTMTVLGRLASGDAAAFSGAVRLKAAPTVTRVRIGIDWRLLFRLLPDRIEVVDLIPRQDLERRIKSLTS